MLLQHWEYAPPCYLARGCCTIPGEEMNALSLLSRNGKGTGRWSRKPILHLSFGFPLDGFQVSYHVGIFCRRAGCQGPR